MNFFWCSWTCCSVGLLVSPLILYIILLLVICWELRAAHGLAECTGTSCAAKAQGEELSPRASQLHQHAPGHSASPHANCSSSYSTRSSMLRKIRGKCTETGYSRSTRTPEKLSEKTPRNFRKSQIKLFHCKERWRCSCFPAMKILKGTRDPQACLLTLAKRCLAVKKYDDE